MLKPKRPTALRPSGRFGGTRTIAGRNHSLPSKRYGYAESTCADQEEKETKARNIACVPWCLDSDPRDIAEGGKGARANKTREERRASEQDELE